MTHSLNKRQVALLMVAGLALAISILVGSHANPASATELPPENTALPTISPTTPYVAQVETATRGTWTGEPTTYSYSWNRCQSKKCETISGATEKKYTPVAADLGKALSVSVTATNSAGSNTVVSAETSAVKESLNWYRCTEATSELAGVYQDSNCTVKASPHWFVWQSFKEQNLLTGAGESGFYRLKFILEGVPMELQCSDFDGEGKVANTISRAEIKELKGSLSSCTVSLPAGKMCEVSGKKLNFYTLKGVSPESPQALKKEIKIEPSSGTALATFEIVNCTYAWFNGTYSLIGSFPAKIEKSSMRTPYAEPSAALQVYGKGKYLQTWFEGESPINYKISGSELQPLKLDVSP